MSEVFEEYYELLGLSADATRREIRKAYKKKARKYHPDATDEPDAEEIFKKISRAYEALLKHAPESDPDSQGDDSPPRPSAGTGSSTGGRSAGSSPSFSIDQLLEMVLDNEADELIVKVDSPPLLRINNDVYRAEMDPLGAEETRSLAGTVLPDGEVEGLLEGKEYDGSYMARGEERFRVNAFLQRGSVAMVFRYIESDIRSFEELNLPESVKKLAVFQRGLGLICGASRSGKSMTLASIVDYINRHERKHIITIEDPIEYVHEDRKSVINQREIGVDTKDYSSALKYLLRQNPDVILLGEMRDRETVRAALEAAETGHMVYSTLHTSSASDTIDRILDFFTGAEEDQIRSQISKHLQGVCAQRLIPRADGEGEVPAAEIMFNTPLIQKLILEDRLESIRSAIHQGTSEGMQTFDQAIVELYHDGLISERNAMLNCSNPVNFEMYKEGNFPDIRKGVLGGLD